MNKMKYETIKYVEKPVSRVIMGTAISSMLDNQGNGEENDKLLDSAIKSGINTIDTARVYGQSENVLGDWMSRRNNRKDLIILSKCAHFDQITGKSRVTPDDIKFDLETSLAVLKTTYIDIYLLHRDDLDVEVGPIVETMNELKNAGKIKAFGASNWTCSRIQQANEYAYAKNLQPFTVSSPNFGLATQYGDPWGGGSVSISGNKNVEERYWYENHKMPTIAYSSLGRGMFSGKVNSKNTESAIDLLDEVAYKSYVSEENFEKLRRAEILAAEKNCSVSQIALAWLFAQPFPTFSVIGATKKERYIQAIDALYVNITRDEVDWLDLGGLEL